MNIILLMIIIIIIVTITMSNPLKSKSSICGQNAIRFKSHKKLIQGQLL